MTKIVLNLDDRFSPIADLDNTYPVKSWTFNSGEAGLTLNSDVISHFDEVIITHRLSSSKAIMEILLAVDAIKRINPLISMELYIPYIPYARQDRVMIPGEPLSIYVFSNLINACGFKKVYYMTPHSDVSKALINNGVELIDIPFISTAISKHPTDYFLCSPDAGALKRTLKTAFHINYRKDIAIGLKERNPNNGAIISTSVSINDFLGQDVYIIDDICSGGRTFVELAKVIKERNAGKIYLVVTHFEDHENAKQLQGLIEQVYCTDSFCTIEKNKEIVTQIPLNQLQIYQWK